MYFYCILCKLSPNQLNYILKLCECIYRGDLPTRKESTSNPVAIFLELFYYITAKHGRVSKFTIKKSQTKWNLPDLPCWGASLRIWYWIFTPLGWAAKSPLGLKISPHSLSMMSNFYFINFGLALAVKCFPLSFRVRFFSCFSWRRRNVYNIYAFLTIEVLIPSWHA